MIMKKLNLIIISLTIFLTLESVNIAHSADWVPSPTLYYKYDSTPLKLTGKIYKYISNNDIELVNSKWIKLPGSYIKYTTTTGGLKYAEQVIISQPPMKTCTAFMCKDDFGITFDLTKNTMLKCPMVKITKEQMALIYEGTQIINNLPECR